MLDHIENLAPNLPAGNVAPYLLAESDIPNNPVIRRLSLGLAAHLGEIEACHRCDSTLCHDILDHKTAKSLLRLTRCVDPRCNTTSMFHFDLKEVEADGYAGLIIPRYDPYPSEAPHPFYNHLDLYMRWMHAPENVAHYGEHGRPTLILLSHDDCGAAKLMASDPAAWGHRPLDLLMKHEAEFRAVMLVQHEAAQKDSSSPVYGVSFADYLSVQIARRTTFFAIEALQHFVVLDPALKQPLVLPLHYSMAATGHVFSLIDPFEDYKLTKVMGFEEKNAATGSSCMRHTPLGHPLVLDKAALS